MTVFISHKKENEREAKAIAAALHKSNIKFYLDVLDEETKTTNDITSLITKRVSESSHLLAVISEKTSKSWWVPFEIGEATISFKRICSYRIDDQDIPEYLEKWPQMTTPEHFQLFIKAYKADRNQLNNKSIYGNNSGYGKNSADMFHDNLIESIRKNKL